MGKLGSYQRQRRTELSVNVRRGGTPRALGLVAETQVCVALGEERSPREALRAGPPLGSGAWPRGPSHTAASVTGHRSEPLAQPPTGQLLRPQTQASVSGAACAAAPVKEQCLWVPASSYRFWPLSSSDQGGGGNGLALLCRRGVLLNVSPMFITF